jgi:hypothetical protein
LESIEKMKKLIFVIFIFFLTTSICVAGQGMIPGMGVKGYATACSATQESNTTSPSANQFNHSASVVWAAQSWTATSSYTLYHVKIYLRKVGNGSVAGDGNMRVYLCTNNEAPTPDAPTATCSETTAKAISTIAAGPGEVTFDIAAGYAITSGTRYWIKMGADTVGDASNYFYTYYNSTGSEISLYADSTPTWSSKDAAALGYYVTSSCP